jgi:hypothetical protein
MGFLSQLLSMLSAAAKVAGGLDAGDQPCHNLQAALQLLGMLVASPDAAAAGAGMQSQRSHNLELLAQHQLQQTLLGLALGGSECPDSGVRAQVRQHLPS